MSTGTVMAVTSLLSTGASAYQSHEQAEEAEEARKKARKRREKAREKKQAKLDAQKKRERRERNRDDDQRSLARRANSTGRGLLLSDEGQSSGGMSETLG